MVSLEGFLSIRQRAFPETFVTKRKKFSLNKLPQSFFRLDLQVLLFAGKTFIVPEEAWTAPAIISK
jgi:hypothetical protein